MPASFLPLPGVPEQAIDGESGFTGFISAGHSRMCFGKWGFPL
jgi:hypothetical protein